VEINLEEKATLPKDDKPHPFKRKAVPGVNGVYVEYRGLFPEIPHELVPKKLFFWDTIINTYNGVEYENCILSNLQLRNLYSQV